jgi:hypothetical protein
MFEFIWFVSRLRQLKCHTGVQKAAIETLWRDASGCYQDWMTL